jgi:hypothetical protein
MFCIISLLYVKSDAKFEFFRPFHSRIMFVTLYLGSHFFRTIKLKNQKNQKILSFFAFITMFATIQSTLGNRIEKSSRIQKLRTFGYTFVG